MSAFTMTTETGTDLTTWLNGHHRIEHPSDRTGNQEIHVYAQTAEGGAVYGDSPAGAPNGYDIQVQQQWGALQLHVDIDFKAGTTSAKLGYALPLRGSQFLAKAEGKISDGITLSFNEFVSGKITLRFANHWILMDFHGKNMGRMSKYTTKLVPAHF